MFIASNHAFVNNSHSRCRCQKHTCCMSA